MTDFKHGDIVEFVKRGSSFTGQKYTVDHIEARTGFVVTTCGFRFSPEKLARIHLTPDPITPTAFKADDGKDRFDLLMTKEGCAGAIADVVKVLSFAVRPKEQGGKGYVPHSWRQVPEGRRRYLSAMYRHLAAIERGEEVDDESGLPHLAHVATNALFLAEIDKEAK